MTVQVQIRRNIQNCLEALIRLFLQFCALVSVLTTLGIIAVLAYEALDFFKIVSIFDFLTDTEWTPLYIDKHFGILPLLAGTFLTSLIALVVALPFGLIVAVYLSEFASSRLRSIVKPILEVLAGVPTIVYGYFALVVVTPYLQKLLPDLEGFNALSPGLVMGIMILPLVASLSEDALHVVPKSLKDAAYGLGATRLQMVFTVLVPAAMGGITSAFILAMSRAVGETMIVAVAAGQQPNLTVNPFQPVETMTAFIVQVSLGDTPHGTLEFKTIFAVASALFLLTLILNNISLHFRRRFENAYV